MHAFPAKGRILREVLLSLIAMAFVLCFGQIISAQCVDHPDDKTAVVFNNESSYDLTFFVDGDEKAMVRSRAVSDEWEIAPGDHLLRARAVLRGKAFWVATVNEVPKGQVCTWTVNDPGERGSAAADIYRSTFRLLSNGRIAPRKREQR